MKSCEKASWTKIEILQGRGRCVQQKDREIPYTRQTGYSFIHHFSCYFCGFCVDRNVLGEWKVERWIGWEVGTADSFFRCAWENKKGLQKHNYDITSIEADKAVSRSAGQQPVPSRYAYISIFWSLYYLSPYTLWPWEKPWSIIQGACDCIYPECY